jgi:ubiquitin-protein ligase
MKTLNPEYAYVSSAVGGPVSQVSLGNNATGSRVATTSSRGIRGKIEKFSRGSRKNLLRHLASINCTAFSAYKGRLIAVGLTYPSEYPEDPKLCKRHLEALHKRLKRTYGLSSPASGG